MGQNGTAFSLVTGTVFYRQRMALPPEAMIQVYLEDVSLPDVAARRVIGLAFPAAGKQAPFPFAVPYRPSEIIAGHRYQLRAAIAIRGGRLTFVSTADYPVITNGSPRKVDILVQPTSTTPPSPNTPPTIVGTYWKLISVEGQPAVSMSAQNEPYLLLEKEGNRLSGSTGCNRILGTYTLNGTGLHFSPSGTTMMACPEPIMKQEKALLAALKATVRYRILGNTMELSDGKRPVARFGVRFSR